MKITCEVLLLAFSEIAVIAPITINVIWFWNIVKDDHPDLSAIDNDFWYFAITYIVYIGYNLILFPIVNTLMHSVLIYHLIRKVREAFE